MMNNSWEHKREAHGVVPEASTDLCHVELAHVMFYEPLWPMYWMLHHYMSRKFMFLETAITVLVF